MTEQGNELNRRDFLHHAAGAAIGASALAGGAAEAEGAEKKAPDQKMIWRNKRDGMTYRRLGRTNYMCSRLAAGWRGNNRLKQLLFNKGVNYFDTSRAYMNGLNEAQLGKLVRKIRDKIFLSSKASGVVGYPRLSFKPGEGKKAAGMYTKLLDESLKTIGVDHLDCYYLHGVAQPWVLETEELYAAFEKAHKAGKVKHNGITMHSKVTENLAKAVEMEEKGLKWFDLVMVACNPNSWPNNQEHIRKLQKHDVGVIAMKATGRVGGIKDPGVEKLMALGDDLELNDRERSYAYMMHIADVDVLISEMQSVAHVEGNLKLPRMKLAAADWRRLEHRVLAEQRDACHHCGQCTAACPKGIEVDAFVRCRSYYHNYAHTAADACHAVRRPDVELAQACGDCDLCDRACPAGIAPGQAVREVARHVL